MVLTMSPSWLCWAKWFWSPPRCFLWEEKPCLKKVLEVTKYSEEIGQFWMVRDLALEFGNQVIGMVLLKSLYIGTIILDWRYFHSWRTWMFFNIGWYTAWLGLTWCSLLIWRSELKFQSLTFRIVVYDDWLWIQDCKWFYDFRMMDDLGLFQDMIFVSWFDELDLNWLVWSS